ncbi:hypothetical protein KIN20_029298 [Parelaphostrongylus tenuis]|uniref:Uncharacterized protein n=1 Tax=Parelaphostrongylus tenuis TaxID=148309 RepID=A0AAD5R2D5_PARTN|nr:hypothetical protein KIN20_029298 [Parelaphostrongylus tenuis]
MRHRTYEKWKLLNGKIVTESQPKAWLSSEPLLLPMNAHFQLDIFSSGSAMISIYQKRGNEELLMWTQSGMTLDGWNRIRLPIRFSPLPSKLLIKTSTRQGQLVAVTNTNIVDESGRDLACGGDVLVIRPQNDDFIRLTALQKLDSSQVEISYLLGYLDDPHSQIVRTLAHLPFFPSSRNSRSSWWSDAICKISTTTSTTDQFFLQTRPPNVWLIVLEVGCDHVESTL